MKAMIRLLSLAAILCVLPAAYAADLSGVWSGSFDFNGNTVPVTMNLKVAGAAVTGTIEGLPTTPADIHDGKVDADGISFWTNTDYEGQTYKLVFKGKVSADKIDFEFGTEDGSWGTTLSVTRGGAAHAPAAAPAPAAPAAPVVPDVTGAWKGNFDFNGTSVPVTFNLKSTGATVTGTVEGMGPAPVEIHDGKIDGGSVTFTINTDYQGQTYQLNYKGKITPGEIDFEFGTADGSWGATVNTKKA
ncbi:MAG TPA: hypothetical protein VKB38_20380 [Terracidiphilus sp.]|nr:hypothetical protein [Terracidiphilus sp.]